jgi:hypothetical protein
MIKSRFERKYKPGTGQNPKNHRKLALVPDFSGLRRSAKTGRLCLQPRPLQMQRADFPTLRLWVIDFSEIDSCQLIELFFAS